MLVEWNESSNMALFQNINVCYRTERVKYDLLFEGHLGSYTFIQCR